MIKNEESLNSFNHIKYKILLGQDSKEGTIYLFFWLKKRHWQDSNLRGKTQ